ncbi:MAG TPA: hypothetical protein VIN67_00950, partial [Desulfobaccales bacterium]
MKFKRIMRLAAPATILTLVLLGLAGSSAAAPQAPAALIKPSLRIKVAPARVRTPQQMEAAAAMQAAAPAMPLRQKPVLRRLNAAYYQALKAKAALSAGRPAPAAPQLAVPQTPITSMVNIAGVDGATAGS